MFNYKERKLYGNKELLSLDFKEAYLRTGMVNKNLKGQKKMMEKMSHIRKIPTIK